MYRTIARRTSTMIILHRIVAIAFLAMLGLGFFLRYVAGPGVLIDLHRSIGVIVLLVAAGSVARNVWQGRLVNADISPVWMRYFVASVHIFLLIATLAMPVTGLAMTLGHGDVVSIFGLINIGPWEPNHELGAIGSSLHPKIAKLLTLAIAVHIAGAYKQHLYAGAARILSILGRQSAT